LYRNFLFGRRLTRLRRVNADSQDFKYKELAAKLEVKRKAFDNLRKQSPARHASPQGEAGGSADIGENLRPN